MERTQSHRHVYLTVTRDHQQRDRREYKAYTRGSLGGWLVRARAYNAKRRVRINRELCVRNFRQRFTARARDA